jgi:hypothetical protein
MRKQFLKSQTESDNWEALVDDGLWLKYFELQPSKSTLDSKTA